MRFCNYVTCAAILVAALLIPLKIQSSEVDTITDVKQSYSNAMETAIDDAMESAVESDHGDDVDLNKDHIIDKFYHTLFINLGCPNDTIKQNAVKAYIPVTVLVARDGFYVNYSTTVTTSNGDKIITKNWSKKIPFTYTEANSGRVFTFSLDDNIKIYDPHTNSVSGGDYHDYAKISSFKLDDPDNDCYRSSLLCDGNFDTIRRTTIINKITETMEYYINQHNKIARQYGISYKFSLPFISEDDWARTINDISLFSVFQGYPYVSTNPKLGFLNIYAIAVSYTHLTLPTT